MIRKSKFASIDSSHDPAYLSPPVAVDCVGSEPFGDLREMYAQCQTRKLSTLALGFATSLTVV